MRALLAGLGGMAALPYDGILSGPFDATGKLEESNLHRLIAGATLDVSPATGSLPVQGEVTAKYNGADGYGRARALMARTSEHTGGRGGSAGAAARRQSSIA